MAYLSKADLLVSLIVNGEYELFVDQFNEPCIVDKRIPLIAKRINSEEMKRMLSHVFWNLYGKALKTEIISTAMLTLSGIASFDHEPKEVYTRVARSGDVIYYDIGDNIHVVKITNEGWNLETTAPVYFKRHTHQLPQVIPQQNGDLKLINKFIHIDGENNEILLNTYLVTCLMSNIDRPSILMHGPQGAGKSTALEFIKSVIDPSRLPLLQPPRKDDEMVQQASKHYAYFLDNLSAMNQNKSDALCRFVTGSAFQKRMLYTNDDDYLYEFKRVTGFTSIAQIASSPDLLERSIIVQLDLINERNRKSEQELNHDFLNDKPSIIGGLFDATSAALRIAPTLRLTSLPRMTDYYIYAAAASEHLGYGKEKFMDAHKGNKNNQKQEATEASPIVQTVLIYMKNKLEIKETSTKLYCMLKQIADQFGMTHGFPKGATLLWKKIQESRATLVSIGIVPERSRDSNARFIQLTKAPNYDRSMDDSIPNISVGPFSNPSVPSEISFDLQINQDTGVAEVVEQRSQP